MNTREVVLETVAQSFNVPQEKIKDSDLIMDDYGADSLDMVEFSMMLEEKLNADGVLDELEKHPTVGGVVAYVESKVGA